MTNLAKVERESVQDLPQVTESGGVETSFWGWATQRGPILPAWGTRERERWLRAYDRHEHNTLWQGASSGLIKKIKATPYELKGGRNLTHRFDDVLRCAQFGQGWGTFLSLMLRDYLRFDGGAYAEIIAPGNPLKAPTGAVTGIAHLDSYRCVPTGDPEYPVVYYSRKGKMHILHHTRLLHLIDMPDGDQDHPGYGLCSLSRAIAVVQRQLYMNQYIAGKLDSKPEPGVVIANNLNAADRNAAFAAFRGEQSTDLPPEWGKVAWFFNLDPAKVASLTSFTFSNPPEKFDYPVYVNLDINELALAIGVDKQELWELSGATGTAGQSIIQAEKSEGKAPGEIRTSLEREINNKLLPDSLEFEWKVRDGRAAQQEATTAQTWAGVATSLAALLADQPNGKQMAAQLFANQVGAVADVVLDEDGQIRLPDVDKKPPTVEPLEVTTDDSTPEPVSATDVQVTVDDAAPNAKDFDATRQAFVADFAALVEAGLADDVSRRRAGVVLRAQISRLGRAAYADGLKAGGVEDPLSDADLNAVAVLIAENSAYVTGFLDSLYGSGTTDPQAHATMWANKSLTPFYQAGLASADSDGMYEWVLGEAEHCASCIAMRGQKHRLKEYTSKGILPQSSVLDCGGFNCACGLVKTSGRSKGNWL